MSKGVRMFGAVIGVDFSGAALAGRNIWLARAAVRSRGRLRLQALDRLEALAGRADREGALKRLVELIRGSRDTLWAIDFPFGLPIEVMPGATRWRDQLKLVQDWPESAHAFGVWCLNNAKKLGGANHLRRTTDHDARTPFDCYHYRIIYQTFHGMRDVLVPLAGSGIAVLPFEPARIDRASSAVVEACPGSTLKRWRLPHQNYKQASGGALSAKRRRTRRVILDGLRRRIELSDPLVRVMMRNPGGDALDAVIAAAGAHQRWRSLDHGAIARHDRYPLEGFIYA